MKFVPPCDALLGSIGISRADFSKAQRVTVPASFLKFLVEAVLEDSDFDEKFYLAQNPDVAEAIRRRQVPDAKTHFVRYGYWEGRRGFPVDEEWYLRKYPDIADAVRNRRTKSGEEHYIGMGAQEFRAPHQGAEQEARKWGAAAGKIFP